MNETVVVTHKVTHSSPKERLLKVADIIRGCVALHNQKCGLYFLISNGRVMYVGQSINVDARIESHRWRGFDRWSFLPCDKGRLNALERRYIDKLMPPWNRDSKTRKMRGDDVLPLIKTSDNPWVFTPEQKAILARDAEEWREYAAAYWTEDTIIAERMRRLRVMKADKRVSLKSFGQMPNIGDPITPQADT